MSTPTVPDAEALYASLRDGVGQMIQASAATVHLVGVPSGGAWLAERLQRDLALRQPLGSLTSAMHRDDFSRRGMASTVSGQTVLPFDINGAHVIVVDDVLYTGRTIRAVLNELFDYGRPASVRLAVLVDRGGRELPIQADLVAAQVPLPPPQLLSLARDAEGRFSLHLES